VRYASGVIASSLVGAGCAGSGDGLDQNGRPIGESPPPLVAEFTSIQENVLTPVCTTCHTGGAAPVGLRLDADVSYAMLVNAPSVEVPALSRVDPGRPDASYLVQKLEGTAAVGERMPLDGPPLPPDTIAVIRQWIVDGALPPAAASAADAPAQLAAVEPMPHALLTDSPRSLVVVSDRELDLTRLGTAVSLEREIDTADGAQSEQVPLSIDVRADAPAIFAMVPMRPLPDGAYRLVIAADGPYALTDRDSRSIDGDGDRVPGGDFTLHFEVRRP
jgi:hypothetical protein